MLVIFRVYFVCFSICYEKSMLQYIYFAIKMLILSNFHNYRMCRGDSGAISFYLCLDRFYLSTSQHTFSAHRIFSQGGPENCFRCCGVLGSFRANHHEIHSYRLNYQTEFITVSGKVKIFFFFAKKSRQNTKRKEISYLLCIDYFDTVTILYEY